MAIARQSDSIWAEAAMGYGRQHSPAKDEDYYGLGDSARKHGEALGRKHADESIRHYNRDERGRFAPMSHHHTEHDYHAGKTKREHRDTFTDSYHKGFTSRVKEHEEAEKAKANKQSSFIIREALDVDKSGRLVMDDPERFRYKLEHGGSDEGYVEPDWLTQMGRGVPEREQWNARHPTERNPYRYDTDTLKNIANDPVFGLGLGMSEKAPFSRKDVGLAVGDMRKKENRGYVDLRPGELASRPIQVEDHLGNVHTFVHQITAPNLNRYEEETDPAAESPLDVLHSITPPKKVKAPRQRAKKTEDEFGEPVPQDEEEAPRPTKPVAEGPWVVSLHHHISRPDGTHEWLPSEVSEHVDPSKGTKGKTSNDLLKDIWGQLHANSDMVTMYGAGAQRVGDKHNTIQYEFPHPSGQVVYNAKLANGYNKFDGYYYDPDLPEKHREALPGGSQWIVTGKGLEREYPHDPKSPTKMVTIEGSDRPGPNTIAFRQDNLPGVIQHVWNGLGVRPDRPSWTQWQQHQIPNRGGLPASQMIRGQAAWVPENNIHRSAERLPIIW
jgi:hypothetical protein